jgi:hypothetical protein
MKHKVQKEAVTSMRCEAPPSEGTTGVDILIVIICAEDLNSTTTRQSLVIGSKSRHEAHRELCSLR